MPPSKPAHLTTTSKKSKKPELTMEQRWALADAKEAFKQAKSESKKTKPSSAQGKVDKAVAKYEHLAQQQLAKQQAQATTTTKEEPAITATNQDEIPTDVDEDN